MTKYFLITDDGSRRKQGHVPLIIPGASLGGPTCLTGLALDRLINAEQAGAHTVLLAGVQEDLGTVFATICRYVATDSPEVEVEARKRFGSERVLGTDSIDLTEIGQWLHLLPRPEAQTLRRRIRSSVRKLPHIGWVYGRITGG